MMNIITDTTLLPRSICSRGHSLHRITYCWGHTPLIFAGGAGARNAIGLVLVCGMAIGTIFTL